MGALEGKSAVVTGAAGSLGAAIARRYVAEGVAHLGLVDLHADQLGDLATELADAAIVATFGVDVTDEAAMAEVVATVERSHGSIDVMVNNAGILSRDARLHNIELADLRRVLDVNVAGTLVGMKAAIPHMRRQGDGVIINTASVAGLTAWPYAGAYSASKAAIIALTKVGAVEYAKEGIRVSCVCPGTFRTAIHAELSEEAMAAITARHPVGRLGTAEEIAGAFVYLAGPDAAWVTGTALVVDGGYSAP